MSAPNDFILNTTTKLHEQAALKAKFDTLGKSSAFKSLNAHLVGQGLKPLTGKDALFGAQNTFKNAKGESVSVNFVFRSYGTGKNKGGLGQIQLKSSKGESSTYNFSLTGDFKKPAEHFIDAKGNLKQAKSWYSAWVNCLRSRCISTCLTSLVTCGGTWAAYFWCVVWRCGGCVLSCAACAGCDCSWWCKWAVGCCHR